MEDCRVCDKIPILLGKKFVMPLLGHRYPRVSADDVIKHLADLNLELVGGLRKRGWTENDIDIIGIKKDIPTFASRLANAKITNPIHYCGTRTHHSHLQCTYYGIKLALTGKGY